MIVAKKKYRKLTREEMDAQDEKLIAEGASPWIITQPDGIEYEWFISRLIPVIPWFNSLRAKMLEVDEPDDDNVQAG